MRRKLTPQPHVIDGQHIHAVVSLQRTDGIPVERKQGIGSSCHLDLYFVAVDVRVYLHFTD